MNCSALQLRAKNSILFGKWCMCRNNSECEWPSAAYGPKILNWEDFESCNVVVLAAAYIEMICRHYSSSRELYGLRRCIARVSFLPVTNHSMRDHIFLVLKSIFHWMRGPMLGLLLPLLLAHFFFWVWLCVCIRHFSHCFANGRNVRLFFLYDNDGEKRGLKPVFKLEHAVVAHHAKIKDYIISSKSD